jgi:cysteine desulfurase
MAAPRNANSVSGTENAPGIIGFGKACELAAQRMEEENKELVRLRDKLLNGIWPD